MYRLLILLVILAMPMMALAQEEGAVNPVTGTYTYEGTVDGEAETGTQTFEGTGPFYTMSYSEVAADGTMFEETVEAIGLGSVIASSVEGETCEPGLYVRQSDGTLFGVWHDEDHGPTAIGVDYVAPQGKSTGFAGTYDLIGTTSTGDQYTAVVTITENEGGWYDLVFDYATDETYPDDVPYQQFAIGTVIGNALGYSYADVAEVPCGVHVVSFGEDGFEGAFVEGDRGVGTSAGTRSN